MTTTKDQAAGEWARIFDALGIPVAWLSDRHTKCPFCKREKKYRYTNHADNGDWICNCGNGNGFALIQEHLGCDFKTAAKEIDKIIGRKCDPAGMSEKEIEREKLRKRLTGIWESAVAPSVLTEYIGFRGLHTIPLGLRGHSGLKWQSGGESGAAPAMVAQVKKLDGTPIAIHRTFLLPEGRKIRMLTPTTEPLSGAAIQLYEPGAELGIAEGIETAIACNEMFDLPVWAGISASMMPAVEIPEGVKRVIVFSDNDRNYTGQAAAYKLANRVVVREKLECDVMVPVGRGDWLDTYLKKQGAKCQGKRKR